MAEELRKVVVVTKMLSKICSFFSSRNHTHHHVRFELIQEQLLLPELHNIELKVIQEQLLLIQVLHHAWFVVFEEKVPLIQDVHHVGLDVV